MDNRYKIYQISDTFIEKYGFKQLIVQNYKNLKDAESWLINLEDKNYQIIRVTTNLAQNYYQDRNRVEEYLSYFKKLSNNENIRFLDIHITIDKYNEDLEENDYLNIDENYRDGIDITNIYPLISNAVHNVEDSEEEIKKIKQKIINNIKNKNNKAKAKLIDKPIICYIIISICVLITLIKAYLEQNYDTSAVSILLGADYKTLTYGLGQFYRLITYAFVHDGFLHLFCNMISLFSIGSYIESRFGHFNFILILFISIIFGSLSQGILTDNGLCMGMSAGIYGLFVVFIIDILKSRFVNLKGLFPTLFINISLNFMSTVAWIAHLGGAIGGYLVYQIISKKKEEKTLPIIFTIVSIMVLIIKYYYFNSIDSFYGGTDQKLIEMYNALGFKEYASELSNKLLKLYIKIGGLK